jgi:hypothetical protein
MTPELKTYPNGTREWYLNGKLHRTDGPAREWYLNGQLHRTDGPAIERSAGLVSREWWLNGQRHRTDGPAIEWADGTREWYLNGHRHRTDGPAIEESGGTRAWYLNGKKCTGKLHRALTQGPAENLLLLLGQGWDEFIEQRLKGRT